MVVRGKQQGEIRTIYAGLKHLVADLGYRLLGVHVSRQRSGVTVRVRNG